jgi:hypothetical protein
MIHIIKNFISDQDVEAVNKYVDLIKFNTKDDHVELHNDLFNNSSTEFDIHTRGEMPKEMLDIFSKYSKGFYDLVQESEEKEYHPPMFSKHYIARYKRGSHSPIHWDSSKPQNTYKSYIYWTPALSGGNLVFPNIGQEITFSPGDLVYFIENKENSHGITPIQDGNLVLSEAWMGLKGQHFMPNKISYEKTDWDNWEIKGF